MTVYRVPFGKGEMEFELPPGMKGTIAISKEKPPIKDVPAAIREALETPANSRPIRTLAKSGDKICIVARASFCTKSSDYQNSGSSLNG